MSGIFTAIAGVVAAGAGAYSASEQAKAAKAGRAGTGSSSGTSDLTTMTGQQQLQFQNILDQLTNKVSNPSQQYSKENAMLDASYVAQNAANEVMKGVPQILSQASSSGAYSATGSQALINDLAQKATAVKAQTILDQINKYAQLDQQQNATNLSAILQAFQIASNSTKKEVTSGKTSGLMSGGATGQNVDWTGLGKSVGDLVSKGVGAYNEFANGQQKAQWQNTVTDLFGSGTQTELGTLNSTSTGYSITPGG